MPWCDVYQMTPEWPEFVHSPRGKIVNCRPEILLVTLWLKLNEAHSNATDFLCIEVIYNTIIHIKRLTSLITSARLFIHEKHTLSRPHGRAMWCLSWDLQRKMNATYRDRDVCTINCNLDTCIFTSRTLTVVCHTIALYTAFLRKFTSLGRSVLNLGYHNENCFSYMLFDGA